MKKPLVKLFKVTGLSVAALLALLFLLPILFPGTVVEKTKIWANNSLDGELDFSKVRLSFFTHFPSLTVSLHNVTLKGSTPFRKDTLITARRIGLGINIKDLIFNNRINFDKIYVSDALIHVRVNEKGEANYNVYAGNKNKKATGNDENAGASLKLEKISISNSHLIYNDKSIQLLLDAKGFNYTGNGDLSKALFDLYSHMEIDTLNFSFDNESYLSNKKIDADLITKINTNSLAFFFQKNDLVINKLPVSISGKLDFLQNGYDIDFTAASSNNNLHDLITALPPQYTTWLEKIRVKGKTDVLLTLKGQYIASENRMPSLIFKMKIREGYIKYGQAPLPASNIYMDLETKIPSINVDSLQVNLDSLFLNVGKDYLKGSIHLAGINKPSISANLSAAIDLDKLDKALGLQNTDIAGLLHVNIHANGRYDIRSKLFPVTDADISWKNGVVKTSYYPDEINNIQLSAKITDATGLLKDLSIDLRPFSFQFSGSPFYVQASLKNFENINYAIKAKGDIDVARIYKVFSRSGLDLEGSIKADLSLQGTQHDAESGNYNKLNNEGTLFLKNIKTYSEYFPLPFIIREGLFSFRQDKIWFDNFRATYGLSDFRMDGHLQNLVNYLFSTTGVLKGNFKVHSNYINANEFMSAANTDTVARANSDSSAAGGVIVIPPNYSLSLSATAGKVLFNDLTLEKLKSTLIIDSGKLSLKETGFNIIGCEATMDATYGSISPSKAFFEYKLKAKDFDVNKAYNEIKIFHDLVTAAGKAQGIVSLDYQLKGKLDGNMKPIYPSLEGGGTLSLKKVKVKGLKLFSVISRKTAKDSIDNPDLSKVDIKSTIKNNIITIERFKFKVAGFRPRIEGQTSFDGQLNLKMRLGLPPLGIIGIPLRITGTQEDPKVRLGKSNKEEIPETGYKEEQ